MLQRGDNGEEVRALQEQLVARGFLSAEDMATGPGIYGPRTESAVLAYKATLVDGIADDMTLASLGLTVGSETLIIDEVQINAVVDISHHNGNPDFAAAKSAGLIGVIHKASQGTGFTDPKYAINRQAASDAGLLWGAYHFATGADPVAQADFFLEKAKPDGQTLLVLDFETNPGGSTMTLDQAVAFVERILEKTGKMPGFYSGHDIKNALGDNTNQTLAKCWFWLAQYGTKAIVPINWPRWTMWQYTDGSLGPMPHEVAGIGKCDRDRFNGSRDELLAFWITSSV